jgi:ribonuclease-3
VAVGDWAELLRRRLGLRRLDPGLFRLALTHASYAHETPGAAHNERLEFLGDAVLGLAVAEALYRAHPEASEGALSRMRAAIVCTPTLARVSRRLGLGEFLLLGHGEESTGGRERASVLANALEAVIGAIYLQHGLGEVRRFVRRTFASELAAAAQGRLVEDFKTALQEWTQRERGAEPVYRTVGESGPDHAKEFTVEVVVAGEVMGRGRGRSKKEAEQAAAEEALQRLAGRLDARWDPRRTS